MVKVNTLKVSLIFCKTLFLFDSRARFFHSFLTNSLLNSWTLFLREIRTLFFKFFRTLRLVFTNSFQNNDLLFKYIYSRHFLGHVQRLLWHLCWINENYPFSYSPGNNLFYWQSHKKFRGHFYIFFLWISPWLYDTCPQSLCCKPSSLWFRTQTLEQWNTVGPPPENRPPPLPWNIVPRSLKLDPVSGVGLGTEYQSEYDPS